MSTLSENPHELQSFAKKFKVDLGIFNGCSRQVSTRLLEMGSTFASLIQPSSVKNKFCSNFILGDGENPYNVDEAPQQETDHPYDEDKLQVFSNLLIL